jgi:hypothetical protein
MRPAVAMHCLGGLRSVLICATATKFIKATREGARIVSSVNPQHDVRPIVLDKLHQMATDCCSCHTPHRLHASCVLCVLCVVVPVVIAEHTHGSSQREAGQPFPLRSVWRFSFCNVHSIEHRLKAAKRVFDLRCHAVQRRPGLTQADTSIAACWLPRRACRPAT